jgi:nucleotide-binding universal stress UspA family protein
MGDRACIVASMGIFGKLAVASTFSPRFLPLLAEAKAVAAMLDRPFEIVHAGIGNRENSDRFAQAFAHLQISAPIHWHTADLPSTAILNALRETGAGLLIAGAMERDSQGRFFLGKVARVLVREAPCSLLLLANPCEEPPPFKRLAIIIDYSAASRHATEAAIYFAQRCGAEELHVLRVFTIFAQLLAEPDEFIKGPDTKVLEAEEERLEEYVAGFDTGTLEVFTRCIEGTTGFAAAEFVQSIEADLLVVASQRSAGQASFPARMEWLENVIPSNLMVIRLPEP